MKKLLLAFLTLVFALCALGLTACDVIGGGGSGTHTHKYVETVLTAPTCTEKGRISFTCSCGDSYESELTDLGHDFTNYISNNDATLTTDGTETATCNREGCTATDTRVDLGSNLSHTHDYTSEVTEPTCTEQGYTTYTCYCGRTYKDNWTDKKEHNYGADNKCTICGKEKDEITTEHKHTYEDKWSYDSTCHFKKATCEHTGEVADKTLHTLISGVCSVCGCNLIGTEGLEYALNDDNLSYYVKSMGTATDADIVIPNIYNGLPVTTIGKSAFYDCDTLESVSIPNSVQEIGSGAFSSCDSLISLVIPDSVTKIGARAFYACYKLEKIVYNGTIDQWAMIRFVEYEGYHDSNPLYYANKLYIDGKEVSEINLSCASYISPAAFINCSFITSVTIPDSVQSVGDYAFEYCSSLNYNIYDNAKYLGNSSNPYLVLVKATSKDITSCKIHNNTKFILSSAFCGRSKLTSIEIPDSVTSMSERAFECCNSLQSVTIGNSVESIGDLAFYECTSLTSVTIGNSVTSIGLWAFSGCRSLTSIEIPNSVTSIGDGAFEYCKSLTSIEIPNSVTSIGDGAFEYCKSLTSIVIGNGVTSMGYSVFYGCTSLQSVKIRNGVTSIWNNVFYKCTSLTSIEIPNSVTSIGSSAFYECTSLTSIEIPNSVTSIGDYAFNGCSSLNYNIYDNAKYLGNSSNPYLVLVEATSKDITSCKIHNNTKFILSKAFYECSSLTSIEIPDSVTSIGSSAFEYCSSLTSIEIPDSVTSIGERAFYECTSLTSVVIGNGVTSIGDYAFRGCTSLTSIEIPNSVTSIGDYAFNTCGLLQSVKIGNSVQSIGYCAFTNCRSLTSVTFEDTSSWYYTTNYDCTGGWGIGVTNPTQNAIYLKSNYDSYYWYKV